jgi:hypothetical protein
MAEDLTICSVVYGDRPWLSRNADLCDALNPGHRAIWRMIANRPVQASDVGAGAERFDVVEGAALTEAEATDPLFRSIHHAKGLNAGVPTVSTRWLLVLDSDCFIVRRGWIDDVLGHMSAQGLAFFGTPYHPRWIAKLRYFPCCVCLFVDLARVPLDALDFTPGERPDAPAEPRAVAWIDGLLRRRGMAQRTRPGRSRDTGIRVYSRYRGDPAAPSECVTPVMTLRDLRRPLRDPNQVLLEKVLPDRWCLLPRRPGAFTDRTFASLGRPDAHGRGCEEYLWRGEPFALHLRGGDQALREDLGELDRLLAGFTR